MTAQNSQLAYNFDPSAYQTFGGGGDFITESGKFPVVIESIKLEPSKTNAANIMAVISLMITDGQLKGQKFIDRLNLMHHSLDTKRMAHEQLTSYATAIGQGTAFNDLSILANRPFQVYVEAKQEAKDGDANKKVWRNSIKTWYYADGQDIVQGRFGSAQGGAQQFAQAGQPNQGYGTPQLQQPQVQQPVQQVAPPTQMQQPVQQPQVQQPQVQQPQVTMGAQFQQPVQQVQQPVQQSQPPVAPQGQFTPPQGQPQFQQPAQGQFTPPQGQPQFAQQ